MSTLKEKMAAAVDSAKLMKEEKVKAATSRSNDVGPETDLSPLVEGWRGEERTIAIITGDIDRDQALRAAYTEATGFGCDTIFVITEGWHPSKEHAVINPI